MSIRAAFVLFALAGSVASLGAKLSPQPETSPQALAPQAPGSPTKSAAAEPAKQPQHLTAPRIQIAILLDTSSSMDGLISQAKSQLWNIVNNLATAKHKGVRPQLQVALYEYGKSGLSAEEGFIRQILPLTDDLDEVSAQLFALNTNGGDEFCGQVIRSAVNGLQWSSVAEDLKFILIAGNEPFTQGTVDYHTSIPAAVSMGITVNTIHCGDEQTGVSTGWKDGALLGEGAYSFIDMNAAAPHVDTPFDKQLSDLSSRINTTYLAYGAKREQYVARQAAQDANAGAVAPAVAVERAATKASGFYNNDTWDLVDAVKNKRVDLDNVKDDELPDDMKKMTKAEREAHITRKTAERQEIQKQIGELSAQREAFIAKELAGRAGVKPQTLDAAILTALKAQAVRKGYEFAK